MLIGGVATIIASFGGLKLNDTLKKNNQIKHFGNLRNQFIQQLESSRWKGNTMPRWEDMEIWKTYYENDKDSVGQILIGSGGGRSENIRKVLNSPTELRDACYDALTNKNLGFGSCDPNFGWCATCLFPRGWHGTNQEY